MKNSHVGETLTLNVTPFKVVGVYEHDGAQAGEVWGDVERMMDALERPFFQRVVARVKPGTDFAALAEELESDERAPARVQSEREYLAAQTGFLGEVLGFLAAFLSIIMGVSAVLGAMNTMLASVAARTHEIGVLLALGYGRGSIFFTFLLESALIGLLGGLVGLLITLPFDGLETGLANWNTFTDVSFAFIVTPKLVVASVGMAFTLGLVGGTLPAWRAARLEPVEAFRTL
jgi:ABC-type lipoprotein release transport system permease subunit